MNKLVVVLLVVLVAGFAVAQTCIVPAPAAPPLPRELVITLPPGGGAQGCTARAIVNNGVRPAEYPIANAKCAVAVGIALQAAANDNGWNDGGTP
jgi:hypothetical protein